MGPRRYYSGPATSLYNLQRRDEKKETRVISKLIHSVSVYSVVSVLGWEMGWSYRTSSFSVDLVTCDVFLFPEVKSALKGKHFAAIYLSWRKQWIPQTANRRWAMLKHGFEQWKIRMQCVVKLKVPHSYWNKAYLQRHIVAHTDCLCVCI